MTRIQGAFTVLVTPFHEDGSLNEEGLRENIRFQVSSGIDGIVALGTTGEDPTLSEDEKELIMHIAREETKSRCHFMVGTGCYSTQKTIENTLAAQKADADSVLVIAPYYNKPTQEGLYQHYCALAKAVDIPIVVYNNPPRTSQNIQPETLKRIATIDNIVGVKEASGNIYQMMEIIETILPFKPQFSVMSGDDVLTYPLLAVGGHGIYSVLSNVMPQTVKQLCDLVLSGDYEKARTLHYQFLPFMRSVFIETNPIPIKAAMNLVGLAAGPCRLPLCQMSQENLTKIKQLYEHIECLC